MGSARSLVVAAPGEVSLVERETSPPGRGEVSVRPEVVGLCGTDLEIIDGTIDPDYVAYPLVLGHEWCGSVEDGTEGAGRLVVCEGVVPCGRCQRCREGRTNLCEHYEEIGFTRNGAASEQITVPSGLLHEIEPTVDRAAAALVEPAAVVFQGLRRVAPLPGWRVLVVGDGTVGLLAALLAQLWAPAAVDLVGARPAQRDLAAQAGAGSFFSPEHCPQGAYDLVIEAAGAPSAVVTALEAARRGGVVLLLGLPPHGEATPVAVDDMVNNDLTLHASFSYTSSAFSEVASLVSSGALRPGFLVTHRFGLEEWPGAVEVLRKPEGARGKVILEL